MGHNWIQLVQPHRGDLTRELQQCGGARGDALEDAVAVL
jgi:hypothetical protein